MHAGETIRVTFAVLAGALLATPQLAVADPLHNHDNGPLTGYFGIPDSTEGSEVLRPGANGWSAFHITASHSISEDRDGESIVLDGETTRFEFVYRRGLAPGFELGVELPYVWHESGGLDSIIDSWHDMLGLPGGFRTGRPNDQLEYRYTDRNSAPLDFQRNANGIGDVRLIGGWQFRDSASHTMALRVGVKLPTGDSDRLLGSGGTDLSVGLAGDLGNVFGVRGLNGHYRVSAIAIGEPDLLADRYRNFVGHLAVGAAYRLSDTIELLAQTAVRSPLYDSNIENLGDTAATLTVGGRFQVTSSCVVGVGVSEDVKVHSAPDVAFQLSLACRPD